MARHATRRRFVRRATAAFGVVIGGSLAGCGGDGVYGDGGTPTTSPTSSPTREPEGTDTAEPMGTEATTTSPVEMAGGETEGTTTGTTPGTTTAYSGPSAREAYPGYDWERLANANPTTTTSITLRNTAFHPVVARVPKGAEVTVSNEDGYGHTMTIPRLGIDVQLGGGMTRTLTFEREGTFEYLCTFHPPDMVGRLIVSAETSEAGMSTASATGTPTESGSDDGGVY